MALLIIVSAGTYSHSWLLTVLCHWLGPLPKGDLILDTTLPVHPVLGSRLRICQPRRQCEVATRPLVWHALCSQGIPHPHPASADSTLCSHTSSRKDYQLTSWILSFSQTVVSQSFFNCGKIYIKLTMLIIKIFLIAIKYTQNLPP